MEKDENDGSDLVPAMEAKSNTAEVLNPGWQPSAGMRRLAHWAMLALDSRPVSGALGGS